MNCSHICLFPYKISISSPFRRWCFGSQVHMNILWKYTKTKIENVKKRKKNLCVHPSIIYLLTSFWEKTTLYVVCAKKTTNNYHVNSHIEALKFVIFTQTQKIFPFPGNLCTNIEYPDVHVDISLTLWSVFSNNGFICTREPNCISVQLFFFLLTT
jgi:hypothetical protein